MLEIVIDVETPKATAKDQVLSSVVMEMGTSSDIDTSEKNRPTQVRLSIHSDQKDKQWKN
jgi:hypothetical protein